jgi:hypothetical protein
MALSHTRSGRQQNPMNLAQITVVGNLATDPNATTLADGHRRTPSRRRGPPHPRRTLRPPA